LAGAQHLDGMQRKFGGVSGAGRDERFGGNDHDAGIGLVTDGDRQLCVRRSHCRICAGGEEMLGIAAMQLPPLVGGHRFIDGLPDEIMDDCEFGAGGDDQT
jgi:hypothetical protein